MSRLTRDTRVMVTVVSGSSNDARDDGTVTLRVEDEVSGEVLVDLEMPAGRWWRLCQGSTQHHDAFVTSHPERIRQRLEVCVVSLPDRLTDDTEKDVKRDVYKAVEAQAPDFLDYQEFRVRRTNQGREAVLQRWVKP